MLSDLHRTPSYLKGLAETRARAAGDVLRLEKLAKEIRQKLADARAEVEACDRLIKRFDGRLDPTQIVPINAPNAAYRGRGNLVRAIERIIRDSHPGEITTTELLWELQVEFELDFETPAQKKRWADNSIRPTIHVLMERGCIERLHDASHHNGEAGRWRWVTQADSLDALTALAQQAGSETAQAEELWVAPSPEDESDDLPR